MNRSIKCVVRHLDKVVDEYSIMVGKVSDSGLTGILQLFDGLQYRLSSVLLPLLSPQSSIFVPGEWLWFHCFRYPLQ